MKASAPGEDNVNMKIRSPSHQALPRGMCLLYDENAKKKEYEEDGSNDLRSRRFNRSEKEGNRREHSKIHGLGFMLCGQKHWVCGYRLLTLYF